MEFSPSKCADCNEFFASDGGRCSWCARVVNGGPLAVPAPAPKDETPTVGENDQKAGTPGDFESAQLVLVGAAVVGAGIGALAGSLAAVVGAGAGAYAATRPSGDRVGDAARTAGRGVVQAGVKVTEVGGHAAQKGKDFGERLKVVETAEKLATVATQKAREVKLSERAAGARERLEDAAHSLDRRARQIDDEYQVSEKLLRVTERVQESGSRAAVGASSMMRWASDQASLSLRRPASDRNAGRAAGAIQDERSEEHC